MITLKVAICIHFDVNNVLKITCCVVSIHYMYTIYMTIISLELTRYWHFSPSDMKPCHPQISCVKHLQAKKHIFLLALKLPSGASTFILACSKSFPWRIYSYINTECLMGFYNCVIHTA